MLGHLISFRTDCDPKILFWNKEEAEELELLGKEVQMKFSDYILCTGHKTQNSRLKCPHRARGHKQCRDCRYRDISNIYTRLDFTGYEELKDEYVKQEFSVYLAGFGSEIVKCGVTRSERVQARLKEQGADYWVELLRFNDGEEAYATEAGLQQRFGLKDFVRNDTKLRLLGKPGSRELLEKKLNEIMRSRDLSGRMHSSNINENDYAVPDSFEICESVNGKVTGCKGQLLFYENDEGSFVVPMHKNTGRIFLCKGEE